MRCLEGVPHHPQSFSVHAGRGIRPNNPTCLPLHVEKVALESDTACIALFCNPCMMLLTTCCSKSSVGAGGCSDRAACWRDA
eukprot:905811-Prorocentrum_minimum.AAC.1